MIQIGFFIWGLFILATRRFTLSDRNVVQGNAALVIGSIFLLVLPLGFVIGLVLGRVITSPHLAMVALLTDGGLIIGAVLTAIIVASRHGQPANKTQTADGGPSAPPADPANPFNPPRA